MKEKEEEGEAEQPQITRTSCQDDTNEKAALLRDVIIPGPEVIVVLGPAAIVSFEHMSERKHWRRCKIVQTDAMGSIIPIISPRINRNWVTIPGTYTITLSCLEQKTWKGTAELVPGLNTPELAEQ